MRFTYCQPVKTAVVAILRRQTPPAWPSGALAGVKTEHPEMPCLSSCTLHFVAQGARCRREMQAARCRLATLALAAYNLCCVRRDRAALMQPALQIGRLHQQIGSDRGKSDA